MLLILLYCVSAALFINLDLNFPSLEPRVQGNKTKIAHITQSAGGESGLNVALPTPHHKHSFMYLLYIPLFSHRFGPYLGSFLMLS